VSDFRFETGRDDEFGRVVWIRMDGVMNKAGALSAIAAFEREVPLVGEFEFRADLTGLEKYEAAAREAWTKALMKQRDRISKIVIVGARAIVRMAAATVALVLRLPMEFRDR